MLQDLYKPIIQDMTWSYSRLSSFEDCPCKWFLSYMNEYEPQGLFYASYGSFVHKLIAEYYNGETAQNELYIEFLTRFLSEVVGQRPSDTVVSNYISQGKEYFKNFEPLSFEVVNVEDKINFSLNGHKFIAIVDYIGEDGNGLVIVDHKSKTLKPRNSKRETQNNKDIDSMLKQLYLYSIAVKEKYGEYPKTLCFNCFRNGNLIREQFDEQKLNETIEWANRLIDKIENTIDFYPIEEYFRCNYLCDQKDNCPYKNMEMVKNEL